MLGSCLPLCVYGQQPADTPSVARIADLAEQVEQNYRNAPDHAIAASREALILLARSPDVDRLR